MLRKFYDNDDAVSVVLGAMMLLAIFMILITIIQVELVPHWNREIEMSHRADIETNIQELRSAIQDVALDGIPRREVLELGTRYPNRFIFINPGPGVQGSLRFKSMNITIDITCLNGSVSHNFTSYRIIYRSHGLLELDLPYIIYEHGIIIKDFRRGNRTIDSQILVTNESINIPIIHIAGMDTLSSIGTESVSIAPFSMQNSKNIKSFNITMETAFSDVWRDVFNMNASNITEIGNTIISKNATHIFINNIIEPHRIYFPNNSMTSGNAIHSGLISIKQLPKLTGISVIPSHAFLPVNGNMSFTALPYPRNAVFTQNINWSVHNLTGSGTINATTGFFRANATGTVNVIAEHGEINRTAYVRVIN